jgi:hypothetical protein
MPALRAFLEQGIVEPVEFADSVERLLAMEI